MSDERLTPQDRTRVVADLLALRVRYPKLEMPEGLIEVYAEPPAVARRVRLRAHDDELSADLTTKITPCQFGGTPDCANCGCIASAGLAAVGAPPVWGFIPVGRSSPGRSGSASRSPGGCVRPESHA